MSQEFNLQEHIAKGVERIVADTLKATLRNPRESAFMVKFRQPRPGRPSVAWRWRRRDCTCRPS